MNNVVEHYVVAHTLPIEARIHRLEALQSYARERGVTLTEAGISIGDVNAHVHDLKRQHAAQTKQSAVSGLRDQIVPIVAELERQEAVIDDLHNHLFEESRDRRANAAKKIVEQNIELLEFFETEAVRLDAANDLHGALAATVSRAMTLRTKADRALNRQHPKPTLRELEIMRDTQSLIRKRVETKLYKGVAIHFVDVDARRRKGGYTISGTFQVHVAAHAWTTPTEFRAEIDDDSIHLTIKGVD